MKHAPRHTFTLHGGDRENKGKVRSVFLFRFFKGKPLATQRNGKGDGNNS